MIRLHPVWAFVVTAVVMTAVLVGVMTVVFLRLEADRPDGLGPAYFLNKPMILGFALLCVTGAGLLVGLPLLALLRWMGLTRRWWAVVLGGLVGGLAIAVAALASASRALGLDDLLFAAALPGFGMASGLLWWLLICGTPRTAAGGQA